MSTNTTDSDSATHPARRLAGIAALLTCALVFDPTRVLPEVYVLQDINQTIALHALFVPLLAAAGLWLVLPKPVVLALCTLMLSIAHSRLGSADLFAGYIYPAVAVAAGLFLVYPLLFRRSAK